MRHRRTLFFLNSLVSVLVLPLSSCGKLVRVDVGVSLDVTVEMSDDAGGVSGVVGWDGAVDDVCVADGTVVACGVIDDYDG